MTKRNFQLTAMLLALLLFTLPVMAANVTPRDNCTIPVSLIGRGVQIHQCADCSFRSRSPFDSRTDAQRCGEEDLTHVPLLKDSTEFRNLFGTEPVVRNGTVKERAAVQRYQERRENFGGVFLPGDDNVAFYILDRGTKTPASPSGLPGNIFEIEVPGLNVDELSLYTASAFKEVSATFQSWELGVPVLWIEYNSYNRQADGSYTRGTAIKFALPDSALPRRLTDAWAFGAFEFTHLRVAQAQIRLIQKCAFPVKIHSLVPPPFVSRLRKACK